MLKGDELITYGFKKVVELLEKIEHNTYTASVTLARIEAKLANLNDAVAITETAALEIQRRIVKEQAHGGEKPKV